MPFDRRKYPRNWERVGLEVRERSGWRCECEGECGLHNGEDFFYPKRRCIERHVEPAQFARGTIILTVAHLNHKPKDVRRSNLKAMCQRCHLRYDRFLHAANAALTRAAKS